MKVNEFKFRVTDAKPGASAVISLADIFGYEGEQCGVFICYPRYNGKTYNEELAGVAINYNSGYGYIGINPNIEIEHIKD